MLATGRGAWRRSYASVRTTREAELLADGAVRQLTQNVSVPRMARGLLDHVDHDPPQAARILHVPGEIVERRRSDNRPGSRDLLLIEGGDALNRVARIDPKVGVLIVLLVGPGEGDRFTGKTQLEPASLDVGEVLDDTEQRAGRRYQLLRRLRGRKTVQLPDDGLPVAIEKRCQHRLLIARHRNGQTFVRNDSRLRHPRHLSFTIDRWRPPGTGPSNDMPGPVARTPSACAILPSPAAAVP